MQESTTKKVGSGVWVKQLVEKFWAQSPENTLQNGSTEKAWERPLVGFARADHQLFMRYAKDLAPFYWTPQQAFGLAFPNETAKLEELSIISWVLPQTPVTRADQTQCDKLPAERWARSRDFGERFNCALRLHVAKELTAAGYPAVAPERLPDFAYQRSERFGIASNWSERHTAHAAGLGTFGLSDGLITPHGKAVRIGSVIARLELPVAEHPYADHQSWCLWYAKGVVGPVFAVVRPPQSVEPGTTRINAMPISARRPLLTHSKPSGPRPRPAGYVRSVSPVNRGCRSSGPTQAVRVSSSRGFFRPVRRSRPAGCGGRACREPFAVRRDQQPGFHQDCAESGAS